MAQHAQSLYEYPASLLSHFHSYLIVHADIARLFLWVGFIIQLSFFGGFFTKKYDRIYLALFLSFFSINYLLMNTVSLELFIFCLVLLDWEKIEKKNANSTAAGGM
jgi:hypothetical protein